ncbi:hypothetical protein GE061_000114 [Apolygus lucorum]|uniref:Ionotropic receptor n=1 Tax=Apolygus lucorum TaxID=248454 RepID=A0A8S9Y4V9_APOLU|nr:hypothetical protein GE061_000114 [Apolygus lucorum]
MDGGQKWGWGSKLRLKKKCGVVEGTGERAINYNRKRSNQLKKMYGERRGVPPQPRDGSPSETNRQKLPEKNSKRFSAVPESDGTFSGFDGEMLKLITTSMNATLKIFHADRSIKEFEYDASMPGYVKTYDFIDGLSSSTFKLAKNRASQDLPSQKAYDGPIAINSKKIADVVELMKYVTHPYLVFGYKLDNGSFNGILGDVYNRRADIACNSIFIKEYGSPDIVFVPAIQIEPLCIVLPTPLLVPNWKMVFRVFDLEVWLCTAFSVGTSMILWYLLNLLAKTRPDLSGSILFIGRIFISTVKLPKSAWQRIFAISLVISACVLSPTFEGSLLKILKNRSYEREIQTMKEFALSDFNIYTFSSNLIEDSMPDYLEGRVRLFNVIDEGRDLMKMVSDYRNLSYLGKKCDIVQRISSKNLQVYVMNDHPRIYFTSYIMRKGNLLIRTITTAVSRILAAGLDQAPRLNTECKERLKEIDYVEPKALDLSNLMIGFYILKVGYISAVVAFLGEVLTGYATKYWAVWSRKSKKQKLARIVTRR